MYVLKQPDTELSHQCFTIHLDHKNPHYLPAKQVVTLEDLHLNKILRNTNVFRHIVPTKIAKTKTYHEPSNTMASDIKNHEHSLKYNHHTPVMSTKQTNFKTLTVLRRVILRSGYC